MLVSYRDYRDVPALTAAVEGARDSLREAGIDVVAIVDDDAFWLAVDDRAIRVERAAGRADGLFTGFFDIRSVVATGDTIWFAANDFTAIDSSGLAGIDRVEAATSAA